MRRPRRDQSYYQLEERASAACRGGIRRHRGRTCRGSMRRTDEVHPQHPFYGARRTVPQLSRKGVDVGRPHVATLMHRMGLGLQVAVKNADL
jgi:hypothetical protein